MKINLYDKWIDYPEGIKRPFKIKSRPLLLLDTTKHHPNKIIARMAHRHEGRSDESGNLLVVVTDKTGYENCLVGNSRQIHQFVADCLSDEGYMSSDRGKKR